MWFFSYAKIFLFEEVHFIPEVLQDLHIQGHFSLICNVQFYAVQNLTPLNVFSLSLLEISLQFQG